MRPRSRRSWDEPAPTSCLDAQCFDLLVRKCVACVHLRVSAPRPAPALSPAPPASPPARTPRAPPAPPSTRRPPSPLSLAAGGTGSLMPGTAPQPRESVGAGVAPAEALPLPALLVGAPAGLGLALALLLLGLLSWRRRCGRGAARPEVQVADAEPREGPLDHVVILPPDPQLATAPVWPPPRGDPATTAPAHSVPVPATELGSTELVTTKTAGPEDGSP